MHYFVKKYHAQGKFRFGNSFMLLIYRKLPKILREMAVYLLYIFFFLRVKKKKFLIFSQGRTGSTLLIDLLNSHPDIFAFDEIFGRDVVENVMNPLAFAEGLSTLSTKIAFGFKVKVYQIEREQGQNAADFLNKFYKKGWNIIYLHRENLLLHAISDIRSEKTKIWHKFKDTINKNEKIKIEFSELLEAIQFREKCKNSEEFALKNLPFTKIIYEEDLLDSTKQQATLNNLFKLMKLKQVNVVTEMKKIASHNIANDIANYNDLISKLEKTKYKKFIHTI